MTRNYLFLALALTLISNCYSQFTMDGEFRPRSEYRHGFGQVIADSLEPGYGISTRLRLNLGYKMKSFNFYMSLQDVFVWGENRQLKPEDSNNSFSVFEAWADVKLSDHVTTKIGRQVLAYDDERILGGVGWAQQARNHDALLFKYKNKHSFSADVGFAFNQDYTNAGGFANSGNAYNTTGFFSYKTMQYLYLKNVWDNFSGSFLFLNNGFQNFKEDGSTQDGISNLRTIGTHLGYKNSWLDLQSNIFFQNGKRQGEINVKGAYLAGLEVKFKASKSISVGAGTEFISGNDEGPGKTGAFFPLYGTNHKFNGLMDYFYVGNHANSVGLIDVHAGALFNFKKSSSLEIKGLYFSGETELPSGDKSLGTELDLVYSKSFDGYAIKAGYSQMFCSDGMYELKGVSKNSASDWQNWAWVMLVIKPKFIKG
ncbi:hypothetical protein [Mangrovimonas xylaniphaga]|uniref:hypothetical protein n=1 Tax=Mangrovimonas xylaniphaga TaxID=1645915 RepID=UPI0006B5C9A7|nr:hypothetical protein [Mangrovimonas xylaniphaga]